MFFVPLIFHFWSPPKLVWISSLFVCLGQRLVGFEVSPLYQDFQFGSQIGFDYKSNVFNTVFDATIIRPMNLPIYFQHLQKYKSFIIKVWNETISNITKVVSYQKTIQNQWFWNTLFIIRSNIPGLISKLWNETISNIHNVASFQRNTTQSMVLEHPLLYIQQSPCFISNVWTWNHFKNT